MDTLPNDAPRGKRATRKRKKRMGIIVGCQRMNGTWLHVAAMVDNGNAVIRDGRDVRVVWSEAYEQVLRS